MLAAQSILRDALLFLGLLMAANQLLGFVLQRQQ